MDDKIALPEDLGALLRQRRKAARLSVSELAERAGKSRDVIYRIEKGEDVASHSLFAVLRAMGLSVQLVKAGMLFPVMDQNLPEGDLFMRLRALFPKQAMTPMHLLALIGTQARPTPRPINSSPSAARCAAWRIRMRYSHALPTP